MNTFKVIYGWMKNKRWKNTHALHETLPKTRDLDLDGLQSLIAEFGDTAFNYRRGFVDLIDCEHRGPFGEQWIVRVYGKKGSITKLTASL